jgi:hypothetical protein
MGCCGSKQSDDIPTLLCFFESGNEDQKAYCLKLKNQFKHRRTIKFEIKSIPGVAFSIKFKCEGKLSVIQSQFDNSDEIMEDTLQKAYKILDE